MTLKQQQLINLPVYTEKNDYLGRVASFEFNPSTHTIIKYYISQSSFVKNLLGSLNRSYDLSVASAQVVNITEKIMIVEDNIIKETEKALRKNKEQVSATVATSFSQTSK